MKRQILGEILYHSIISKSKYEQAVQGLFTIGTSITLRSLGVGGHHTQVLYLLVMIYQSFSMQGHLR